MAAKKQPYRGFDLLSRNTSFAQSVQESLASKASYKANGKPVRHGQLPSQNKPFLKLPDLAVAFLFQMRGLISQRVMSIIGPDRVGKTSFAFTMAGWAMRYNSPVYYLETESKFMLPDRIKRCLHTDPAIAERMYNAINFEQAFSIKNAVDRLENWVRLIRQPNNTETYVPIDIPVVVIIDSLSKLMPPKEAQGRSQYPGADPESNTAKDKKTRDKAEKRQELDEGSTQEFAKTMHKWCRSLPEFLNVNNVLLLVIEHQNQEVNMRGGSSFIPQIYSDMNNRTKIGGNAINQNVTYQITLVPYKQDSMLIRGKPEIIGRFCRMTAVKNSAAAGDKTITYRLQIKAMHDTATYREPVMSFDVDLGDLLQRSQVLDIRPGRTGTWSCREFGGADLEPRELAQHFYAHPELHEAVYTGLDIGGGSDDFKTQAINPVLMPVDPMARTEEDELEEAPAPPAPKVTKAAPKAPVVKTPEPKPPAIPAAPILSVPTPPAPAILPTASAVSKPKKKSVSKPSMPKKSKAKSVAVTPAVTPTPKPIAPAAPASTPLIRAPKPPLAIPPR